MTCGTVYGKGDSMVNVGIIGAGRIGKVHVESICTQVANAKVKMLADPFMTEETAAWAKAWAWRLQQRIIRKSLMIRKSTQF